VKYGYDTKGHKIVLRPVGLATTWDIVHDYDNFLAACNGTGSYPGTDCRMNGFDDQYSGCGHGSSQPPCPNANPPYSYVPHSETVPYFYLGEHYVLADQMYASNVDASSFISHQYIIAGQASSAVNYPSSWWGCEGTYSDYISTLDSERQYGTPIPMCWKNKTLGDEMDAAGLSWAYYASTIFGDGGMWSAYQNISQIYGGHDWKKDVISPQTDFFGDVKNGKLRDLTWVTPTCENSDHAGCNSKTGPSWVASLVNAIGKSKYWDSTAIFIFWDDYGGWYDPEPPARVDYDGLGVRLPLLIVSPYAKQGYVSHTHYEHGSILKFVEETFGLAPLAASDKRANAPDDAFDFNAPPRKFETVPSEHGIDYFMHQPPDYRLPDSD
jgi:phospholipase C